MVIPLKGQQHLLLYFWKNMEQFMPVSVLYSLECIKSCMRKEWLIIKWFSVDRVNWIIWTMPLLIDISQTIIA